MLTDYVKPEQKLFVGLSDYGSHMPPVLPEEADTAMLAVRRCRRRLGWRRAIGASCPSPNPRNEVHYDEDFQLGAITVRSLAPDLPEAIRGM